MPKLIIAAAAVLILTNVVVLAGVAYNRSGAPVMSIDLTERELSMTPSISPGENSGTSLTLKWRALGPIDDAEDIVASGRLPSSLDARTPAWLDKDRLLELGFDLPAIERDIDKHKDRLFHRSIEVYLVLEYGGDSWQKVVEYTQTAADNLRKEIENRSDDAKQVKRLEHLEKRLDQVRTSSSRLYVIDAGADRRALLDRYADSGKYLLARGRIGLRWNRDEQKIVGRIRELAINRVHVPLPYSPILVELDRADRARRASRFEPPVIQRNRQPRYSVRLNIGNRLEPWIESVALMDAAAR